MIDLVVAGGGPAGLAAAIAARRAGMSVVVVEPKRGTIDKACGEGIMPGGVAALAELGVHVEGFPFAGIRWIHAGDAGCSAVGSFPKGRGLGVRRTVLHDALRERAVTLGVRWEVGRITSLDGNRSGWLIGADGLRSDVRRLLGVERAPLRPPRFGMRRHFRIAPWTDRVEVQFADRAEAYVTPVAHDTVGVAFLFEPPATWRSLLARFPLLARRLAGAEPVSALCGAGPFERRVARRVDDRVLLVGDAAGYLDPLTGEGIALGIETAKAAVAAIARGDPRSYEAEYAALTRRYRLLTTSLLAIARYSGLHRALIGAARAFPFAFDRALGELADLGGLIDRGGTSPASLGTPRGLPTKSPRSRSSSCHSGAPRAPA